MDSDYLLLLYIGNDGAFSWREVLLNSSWIPYILNQSNPMMQNQTAEVQFVSITYNLNEYTHYLLSCKTQSDEG